MPQSLKTIKASEFKAKFLGLIDQATNSGQELIIAKNQKLIVKLTSCWRPKTLLGIDKGKIEITGDITISPVGSN